MTPHPQFSDLKAIEDYIYSSMNHTPEWRKAEEAFQRILSHTPVKSEQEIREKVLDEFPNIITCILMKRLRGVGDEILEELRRKQGEQR